MPTKRREPEFSSFRAVYCSGWFIDQPTLVTAASLLFERVHFINDSVYVQQFAKNYLGELSEYSNDIDLDALKIRINDHWEALYPDHTELTADEVRRVIQYVLAAKAFWQRHQSLIGPVFDVDPNSNVFFQLNDEDESTNLSKIQASSGLTRSAQANNRRQSLESLLISGAIPLFGQFPPSYEIDGQEFKRPKALASVLAQKSVAITLPALQATSEEIILEARTKLRDQLSPFWAEMLRLSSYIEKGLADEATPAEIERACEDFVDANVRPHLIELRNKLEMERRNWAYKILGPIIKTIALVLAKPPSNPANWLELGTALGQNITPAIMNALTPPPQPTLTYLVELDELAAKKLEQ